MTDKGRTSGVTGGVGGALLAADGREPRQALGLLADAEEHVDGGDIADVVRHLELQTALARLT